MMRCLRSTSNGIPDFDVNAWLLDIEIQATIYLGYEQSSSEGDKITQSLFDAEEKPDMPWPLLYVRKMQCYGNELRLESGGYLDQPYLYCLAIECVVVVQRRVEIQRKRLEYERQTRK